MQPLLLLIIFYVFFNSINASQPPAQDFEDKVDPVQEDDTPSSQLNVMIGLPVGTWKITDLNSTVKESVCNDQIRTCNYECGGDPFVSKNFCNKTSMAWGCVCKNHVPVTPPYSWPITIAECRGKEKTCYDGCTYQVTKRLCIKGCAKYYKCNQPGSPPSGLNVESEDIIPQYNLPISDNIVNSNSAHSSSFSLSTSYIFSYLVVLAYILK